jgi:hypothetical protein
MDPVALQLVLTFHQPLSAQEKTIDRAAMEIYRPLLTRLKTYPSARLALHIDGHVLDRFSQTHEDLLQLIKDLAGSGQVEILGGPFYGAAPALVTEADIRGQIEMMAEYWESLLGVAPQGFWLQDLAWSVEVPRLLDETGLTYGFVSPVQLDGDAASFPSLGTIARGSQRIAAFLLDDEASAVVAIPHASAWLEAIATRAKSRDAALTTAWQRAELLLPEESALPQWDELLQALGGGRQDLASVLPALTFISARPAAPVELIDRSVLELAPYSTGGPPASWVDFPRRHNGIDTLMRRVQRASDKLREAIATMEDESIEESWSDTLATAQRLVFGAQCPEAFRPSLPPDQRRVLQQSALKRIVQAETMIEQLVQGNEDWIATEEEDRDGDLVDEIFVSNGYLSLWFAPTDEGSIRTLDDRRAQANLVDLDSSGRGVRTFWLEAQTTAERFFSESNGDLVVASEPGEITDNRIDEDGDASFHFKQHTVHYLDDAGSERILVNRELRVPIDTAEIRLTHQVTGPNDRTLLCAVQLPLRLVTAPAHVLIDGNELALAQTHETEGELLRFLTDDGAGLEIQLSSKSRIWLAPGGKQGGIAVVPALRVVVVSPFCGTGESGLTLRLLAPPQPEPVAQAA